MTLPSADPTVPVVSTTPDPVTPAPAAPAAPVVGMDPAQFRGVSAPGAGSDALAAPAAAAPAAAAGEVGRMFPLEYVQELRDENANTRVKLREFESSVPEQIAAAVQEAVTRTKTELTQTWAQALGVTPAEDQTPPDPAVVLEQAQSSLTRAESEATAARAAHRSALVANAVLRASEVLEAHGDKLLDSTSFMNDVAGLDPAASDFATQVAAKITERVTADGSFRRAQGPTLSARSGGDMSAGNADTSRDTPPDVESLRRERAERRGKNGRGRTGIATGESTPMTAEWAAFFNQQ